MLTCCNIAELKFKENSAVAMHFAIAQLVCGCGGTQHSLSVRMLALNEIYHGNVYDLRVHIIRISENEENGN